MDAFDSTCQGTGPLLFTTRNLRQLYAQRVHFRQLAVLLRWSCNLISHSFFFANPASQPYKNTKSRSHTQLKFPLPATVLSLNPKYHREKKPNPASRQTYWEPSRESNNKRERLFGSQDNQDSVLFRLNC